MIILCFIQTSCIISSHMYIYICEPNKSVPMCTTKQQQDQNLVLVLVLTVIFHPWIQRLTQPLCLWSKNTFHSLQITAMWSYRVINLITKWNPVRGSASLLVIWYALFLWSLPQWEMIGQSAKKSVEVPPPSCLLCFSMQEDVAC